MHVSIMLSGTRQLKMKVWSTGDGKGQLSATWPQHVLPHPPVNRAGSFGPDTSCLWLPGRLVLLVFRISTHDVEATPLRPSPCSLSI